LYFWNPKIHQNQHLPWMGSGLRRGSLQSSQTPKWWEGGLLPLPNNSIPALAPSGFGRSGLARESSPIKAYHFSHWYGPSH